MKIEDLEKAVRLKEQIGDIKNKLKTIEIIKRCCGLSITIDGTLPGYLRNKAKYEVKYDRNLALKILESDELYYSQKLISLECELADL